MGLLCSRTKAAGSGNIIDAASASSAHVQAAIDSAVSGDTVRLPIAGSATWSTSAVSIPSTKGITLDGRGSTITRSAATGSSSTCFTLNTNATTATRVTGINFVSGGGAGANERFMVINSGDGHPRFRVDNCEFDGSDGNIGSHIVVNGPGYGLIDHCTIESDGNQEVIQHVAYGPGDDTGWTNDLTPGSLDALYVEDCTFINHSAPSYFGGKTLATYGARVVYRFNTFTRLAVDVHGNVHPTGRWCECYGNTMDLDDGDNVSDWFIARGGSGLVYDNVANGTNDGGGNIVFYEDSDDGDTGSWPQAYQVGMGKLTGVTHARAPYYVWGNTGSDGFNVTIDTSEDNVVQFNRDVYSSTNANGVRTGTLATMNGLVGMTQYQAFWATDHGSNGGLYVYSGSAWELYYEPAVYPHPLNV